MGVMGLVFALFTVGYILGVWTACLVFRRSQRAEEDVAVPVIVITNAARLAERR
jgi:hypothetical protein